MIGLLFLLFVAVAIAVVVGLYTYSTRESIKRKCRDLTTSWDLLVQALRDRSETLPKLVAEVKHTTGFEEDIFHEVEAASQKLAVAETPTEVCEAIISGREGVSHLDQIAEYYPPLSGSEHYLSLKAEAKETEVRIERERGIYNRTVQEFNDLISKTAVGRSYAKRASLMPNEKVEQHRAGGPSRPTTAPIRLSSALG